METFIHLHCHSNMSILDALPDPEKLGQYAADRGMSAIALTDHGNLHAAPAFVRGCKEAKVKPILGCEFYQVRNAKERNHVLIPEVPDNKARRRHITVLAKNKRGWQNLMKLQNWSFNEGHWYKPRIDFEMLAHCQEGLIVLSGCISSELSQTAAHLNYEEALSLAKKYQKYLGESYYLEITALDRNDFRSRVFTTIARIHEETDIPLVITGDVHYINASDAVIHAFMTKLGNKKGYRCEELWLKNRDEVWNTFVKEWQGSGFKKKSIIQAIDRTVEIADDVDEYSIEPRHSIGNILLCSE